MKYKDLPIAFGKMANVAFVVTVEGYPPGVGLSRNEALSEAMSRFLTGFFARCAAEDKENALTSKTSQKSENAKPQHTVRLDRPKSSD